MPAATKNMPNPANNPVTDNVRAALRAFTPAGLPAHARALLNALGYTSERTRDLGGSPQNLLAFRSPAQRAAPTKSEQSFLEVAKSAHIIFQYTDQEIESSGQMTLLEGAVFEYGRAQSFLFIAVELTPGEYARGKYAEMTREISKRFAMPVCVLFENGGRITLAFAHRRESKRRGETRDILGKVSLIRDVNCADPHRAHLDILAELALAHRFGWMESNKKPKNFDGLLQAWQAVLDTEELNKRFYRDMFKWFEWAVADAKFPKQKSKTLPAEDHVIRLITRILFVWFIKEKKLVAEELFNEAQIAPLLKNYDRKKGDDYYRAILQNLFFATLNTKIGKRGFSKGGVATHRNFNLLRYKDLLADSKALLRLLSQTPFINGGLFDCLDSEEGQSDGGYRLDCFSDHLPHRKLISIPNRLFFDPARGLFTLLGNYKFTVEENTPIEQEVALDPELLGKIFENLLAAYNPETRGSVRKQTGSYYTPRAIVDYMVDEALVASISQKAMPASGDAEFFEKRLRYLLNYADAGDAAELFDVNERREIIRAISQITALDPAAGSGAFPMGILHKLTFALRRLDPKNQIWEELQIEHAVQRSEVAYKSKKSKAELDTAVQKISDTFARYTTDFGRKLYLIQNSIFGVDIQPVACQIAKLRFFISLAIEQKRDAGKKNFGIKPLPNLETRFVSADALIGLRVTERGGIRHADISELEEKLRQNRERHFNAGNRREKLACGAADKKLRRKLGKALEAHYRRDADWNAARRIVEAGLETLRRELAKLQSMQSAVQQDTFLPDEREQGDWQGEIALLQAKKKTGEKLLADIRRKDNAVKTRELWKEAVQMARAEEKLIHAEAQKLSAWDPYDQNASAEWFDAEWMFGIAGGFDVVIGNPPYVKKEHLDSKVIDGLEKNFHEAKNGKKNHWSDDLYTHFIFRGAENALDAGVLSYIANDSFIGLKSKERVRRLLMQYDLRKLIRCPKETFGATIYTAVFVLCKRESQELAYESGRFTYPHFEYEMQGSVSLDTAAAMPNSSFVFASPVLKLYEKLSGLQKVKDHIGVLDTGIDTGNVREKIFFLGKEKAGLHRLLQGKQIERWRIFWDIARAQYKYCDVGYVSKKRKGIGRKGRASKHNEYWGFRGDIENHHQPERLLMRQSDDDLLVAYHSEKEHGRYYTDNTLFTILPKSADVSLKYAMALLNSKLLNSLYHFLSQEEGKTLAQVKVGLVNELPFCVGGQKPIIALVDKILAITNTGDYLANSAKKSQVCALEAEIDHLVYRLYRLTPAEIVIVEQTRAPA